MAQSVVTSGSIEGVYTIVFASVTVTINGVSYVYSGVRRKINANYGT